MPDRYYGVSKVRRSSGGCQIPHVAFRQMHVLKNKDTDTFDQSNYVDLKKYAATKITTNKF